MTMKATQPTPMHARRRNRDTTLQPTSAAAATNNNNCKLSSRTAAACLAAIAACCAPRLGEAFLPLSPPPRATFTAAAAAFTATGGRCDCRLTSSRSKQPAYFSTGVWRPRVGGSDTGAAATTMMMAAAKGFGKSAEPSPSTSTGDKSAKEATGGGRPGEGGAGGAADEGVGSWEKEYKAYIKRTGQYLCSMSWEGHEEMGRGAIFANYDDARAGGKLNDADKFGGIPSMYVPLTEFESMREAQKAGEEDDLAQIVRRVQDYRPEKEFVVVFQAAGVMGADIVRPNVTPPEMAKHVVKSDGVSTLPSATGLDGVIDVN